MQGFIEQVAKQLYDRYGDDISSLYLIFPSRRARLFFADALSSLCDKPIWQPSFTTIDELMSEVSRQHKGDNVRLITELYKVWSRYHAEPFDSFYFWGEMLLADFDAVDKYLVDAAVIFTNIRDVKHIDGDYSYLTPDQQAIIKRFWDSFGNREGFSGEQENFIGIWNTLSPIYKEYRESLSSQGLAYTGMMHRTATEQMNSGEIPQDVLSRRYAVIGFNALTECEKKLFDYLRANTQVDFFWDYDNYYLENKNNEAGEFMRSNVQRYPVCEPLAEGYNNFSGEKEIVVVSAPSDTLQCKYVNLFLKSLSDHGVVDKQTAIVLSDESLLETLLYSMPEQVENINITMGYPIRQTLVYSFTERLLELQKHKKIENAQTVFYHSDVVGLLRHPFVMEQCDTTKLAKHIVDKRKIYSRASSLSIGEITDDIFTACDGWKQTGDYLIKILSRIRHNSPTGDDPLRMEYLSLVAGHVRKLCNSLQDCGVDISDKVFYSLLRRQLQTVRVPYEGEPLKGVQIMGFLETRALDFENVVILSVNDDILPGNHQSSSFVPYNLKIAYGLPTSAHHEAMYAYYFYRLLQRAKRIHLVYCSRSDDKRKGEPSRYIYQLDYESGHKIEKHDVALDAVISRRLPVTIEKSGAVLQRLNAFLDINSRKRLSPTAFFQYVICPLKFYYNSIARIAVEDEFSEQVDSRLFGNILHYAMELLYGDIKGNPQPQDSIRSLIGSPKVDEAVSKSINEQYLHEAPVAKPEMGGDLLIVKDVILRYLNDFILPYDASQSGFCVESMEQNLHCGLQFESAGKSHTVYFYGKADRIDTIAGGIKRIIDYKTGKKNKMSLLFEFTGIDSLFIGEARGAGSAAVQTLLYATMLRHSHEVDVQPAIYAVRYLRDPGYSPLLLDRSTGAYIERYSDCQVEFETELRGVLSEIFDPRIPFTQCEEEGQCVYCDFKVLCGRDNG